MSILSEIIFIYAIDEKTPANFRLKVSIQGGCQSIPAKSGEFQRAYRQQAITSVRVGYLRALARSWLSLLIAIEAQKVYQIVRG